MGKARMVEPHPIGVVKHINSSERLGELLRVVESERKNAEAIAQGQGTLGGIRKGNDRVAGIEEPLGQVSAGVAESPGDSMDGF
jgi:hypothetical protein